MYRAVAGCWLWVLLVWLGCGHAPAMGQTAAPAQPAVLTPPAADMRRVLEILRDDRRRAELIAALEAIQAGQAAPRGGVSPAPAGPAQDAPSAAQPAAEDRPVAALPLAPDSLGANLLLGVTELTNRVAARLWEAAALPNGVPWLASWAWTMVADPMWRALLVDAVWRLVLAFAAGLAGMAATRWLLRRPRARLLAHAPVPPLPETGLARAEDGETEAPVAKARTNLFWRRLPFVLGCLALDLLAVLAFLLSVHALLATPVAGSLLMQLVLLAPLHGFALWQVVLGIGAAITAPGAARLRLLPAGDAAALYLQRQLCWLSGLVIMGDAVARMGWLLGMTAAAQSVLMRLILVIAHIGLAVIVLRQRARVAAWLMTEPPEGVARGGGRARLAPVWHWIALAALLALLLVLLLGQAGGTIELLGFLLGSGGVLVAARLANTAIGGALDRLEQSADGAATQRHALHGWLRIGARGAIGVLGVVLLFQVWGFPVLPWLFASVLGRQVLGGMGTIGITLAMAVVLWEGANLAMNRHIAGLQAAARPGRAARLRTLLPMLRTALFIGILIMVGLTVLSQLGVNIAPLLAGAGVLGIAIGFGSQKLVQDVITGLFLLLENVMQVGDVVTLGGLTGVVEELSIRSIRLRAEDGAVHVIPFSAVTTVTNMTRDFGHAVIEARVAITEDYERVVQLLRDVFAAMRAEPIWETDLIGDLDMMGLARMDDSAMVIKCRLRCGPFARWRVLREFQRRMQQSFAANGVALPVTVVTAH